MIKTRSKRAYYNMVASGVYEVVVFVISLFVPRVVLATFGSSDNGLTLSISQFLSYISFLTLGVAGPTRVALYKSLSQDDIHETSAILKATEAFYRKISGIFIIYTILLAILLPVLVESGHKWYEVALLVLIIGSGMFTEYCFGITYQSLLYADQKQYIYYIIKISIKILDAVVAIILMNSGASLFTVKLGTAIFNTITPLCLYYYVHKEYSIVKRIKPNNKALDQRKDAAASSIANIVHNNTDIVLLSLLTNTLLVSVYSVYMLVMNGLTSIMKVFTSALEAPFGNAWAKRETKVLNHSFEIYEYLMYAFVAVVFSCTAILIGPFVSIYTNVVHDIDYDIAGFAYLLTLSTAVYCLRQPYITLVQAAGKYKETRNANIVEALLNLIVSLFLVKPLGLIGVTLGTLIANIYRTVSYSYFVSNRLMDRPYSKVIKKIVWVTTTSSLIILIYTILFSNKVIHNWIEWIIFACEAFVLAFAITFTSSSICYRKTLKDSIIYIRNMIFG